MNVTPEKSVIVQELTRKFGQFTAVDRVSFEVAKGEIFGFLGPNGAGKSTTIQMLCGILAPTSGRGQVGGYDIARQSERIKQGIGYMSQKFSLYEDLTVEQNINFYSGIYNVRGDKKQARKEWVIQMAGLADFRRSRTRDLSTGWKQRLALGCAIIHEPGILFLDEPTAGVDPISRRNFWRLIKELAGKGVTVFVTTHYMDEAENCDRLALIYQGRIIALGTPHQLKSDFMAESVLAVRLPQSEDWIYRLKVLPGVREAALFGTSLHITTRDVPAVTARLEEEFRRAGLTQYRIEPVTPSLEDVFVSLIESYDRRSA